MASNSHGRDLLNSGSITTLGGYNIHLWGMPTAQAWVYWEHINPFLSHVLNLLRTGGMECWIAGTADKIGSRAGNERAAKARARFVTAWLWIELSKKPGKFNRDDDTFLDPDPIIQPDANQQPGEMWRGVRIRVSPNVWIAPDGPQVDS
jgi:hypothetical protein